MKMRNLLAGLFLALSLVGCANNPFSVVRDPAKLVTLAQKLDAAIDQANATIAATARQLINSIKSGAIDKVDGTKYYNLLMDASKAVDTADEYLKVGDLTSAQGQLALETLIVNEVTAYLVKMKGTK